MQNQSEILQHEYKERFESNAAYRDSVWKVLCAYFSRYIKPSDEILDLGAGWGEFSRNINAKKKYSMDLNPDCGALVNGFSEFLFQDCSKQWPLENQSLDVVFTSNFLEHLPNKSAIEATLKEACRCLRTNGTIICLGPNIRYLPGLYWDYWDHHVAITDSSMVEVLKLSGFEIVQIVPRFLPYTMSNGKNPPLFAVKTYLKLSFLWPLLGKQFLIIAKKP